MKGCEKSGQSLLDAAMANTMTVKEAAMLWGVTERWVTVLCKERLKIGRASCRERV